MHENGVGVGVLIDVCVGVAVGTPKHTPPEHVNPICPPPQIYPQLPQLKIFVFKFTQAFEGVPPQLV